MHLPTTTMASAKPEAAAQEQPHAPQTAPAAPSNHNLEMLQGMLNMVVRDPIVALEDVALTTLCSS